MKCKISETAANLPRPININLFCTKHLCNMCQNSDMCHYSDICVVILIYVIIVTGEHQVWVVGRCDVSRGSGEAGRIPAAPAVWPTPWKTSWVLRRCQSIRSSGRTAEVNAIDGPCFMVIFSFCRQYVWSLTHEWCL